VKPASELTLEELSRWARAASSSRFSLRLSARSWWSSMMSESSASYAAVMAVRRCASRLAGGRGSPRGISKTFPILLPLNRLNDPLEWGQWLTVRWCGEAVQLSCVVRYLCFPDVPVASNARRVGSQAGPLHDARHSCATLMHLRQVPTAVICSVARSRQRNVHDVGVRAQS
jgi:hypothetical protein